jgi:hypothetical protein
MIAIGSDQTSRNGGERANECKDTHCLQEDVTNVLMTLFYHDLCSISIFEDLLYSSGWPTCDVFVAHLLIVDRLCQSRFLPFPLL